MKSRDNLPSSDLFIYLFWENICITNDLENAFSFVQYKTFSDLSNFFINISYFYLILIPYNWVLYIFLQMYLLNI